MLKLVTPQVQGIWHYSVIVVGDFTISVWVYVKDFRQGTHCGLAIKDFIMLASYNSCFWVVLWKMIQIRTHTDCLLAVRHDNSFTGRFYAWCVRVAQGILLLHLLCSYHTTRLPQSGSPNQLPYWGQSAPHPGVSASLFYRKQPCPHSKRRATNQATVPTASKKTSKPTQTCSLSSDLWEEEHRLFASHQPSIPHPVHSAFRAFNPLLWLPHHLLFTSNSWPSSSPARQLTSCCLPAAGTPAPKGCTSLQAVGYMSPNYHTQGNPWGFANASCLMTLICWFPISTLLYSGAGEVNGTLQSDIRNIHAQVFACIHTGRFSLFALWHLFTCWLWFHVACRIYYGSQDAHLSITELTYREEL